MRHQSIISLLLIILLPLIACGGSANMNSDTQNKPSQSEDSSDRVQNDKRGNNPDEIPTYTYEVVNSWPHDPNAFTQGLVYHEGTLFESTGLNGQSSLRMVDLRTGAVIKKFDVSGQYFAEGMTIFRDKMFQLTWLSFKGFIYDINTFQPTGEFNYTGEGWGLTHDDKFLIMSDGSNRLRFLDPDTFEVKKTVSVFNDRIPLNNLNELEYINGEIFANIWQTDYIVRIDPKSGKILGWIDLTGLLPPEDRTHHVDVLNGIAYDKQNNRIFVTGKLWPKLFEIKLRKK